MERLLVWIRDHPQFAAIGFVLIVLTIVMSVLGISMHRAGLSLKPLIWFLGFFAIVGGPQAVMHLIDGYVLQRTKANDAARPAPANGAEPAVPAVATHLHSPVPWPVVFGPEADPTLIVDAKQGLAPVIGDAMEAKLSFHSSGDSALAARFNSAEDALKAQDKYGTFFTFAQASGSDADGWTARRHQGQGEWVHVVAAGPELYAWTSASRETVLAQRSRALGPISATAVPAAAVVKVAAPELFSKRLTRQTGLMIAIVGLNLVAATLWFFKGSAWSARIDGAAVALPADAASLRGNLLGLNRPTVPTEVTTRPDGAMEVTWRYGDARWFDLMRVHRLKRAHRLVLIFDEARHTVRVREYISAFDASASPSTLRLDWKAMTGIQFFAFEQKRVFGAQLASDGRPTGELSQAYTFNLQELKGPLIEVVTQAGWHWQPLTWNAPESLRWLTE